MDYTSKINPNQSVPALIPFDRKFRHWLIELTSFKPKLLIRFIMNKPCQNKLISISCSGKINKIR